jgi:MmyB-like transcription regulator ligand binding domain
VAGTDPEQLDGGIGHLIALVDSLHPNPAYLLGPMTRILAWNRAASVVLGSPDHPARDKRYLLWWLMVDPGEPEYEEFVAQLREHSARFREWWDEHEVIEAQRGTKMLKHPRLGTLRLHHAQTVPTGQPELRMAVDAPADEATRAVLAAL